MLFDTIVLIDGIISHLSSGKSVVKSIDLAAQEHKSKISEYAKFFLQAQVKGEKAIVLSAKLTIPENKILFVILEMGMKGLPILQLLEDFLKEVKFSNSIQIENFQRTLPFKLMVPLLLCYFPSLILLFIGPFIIDFLSYSSSM